MAGAFQTAREIFDNPIWQNIVEFRLFFLIYGKATFTDGVRIGDIELKRGQWVRSYRNLQHDLEYIENNAVKRYSLSTIKRAIACLEKDERIISKTCKHGTLFEVVNYAKYQCLDNYKTGTRNSERTENEQRKNSNETATEQRPNNNKNAKNAKNAKNSFITAQHLSMTEEEYNKLVTAYGKDTVDLKIDYARNYSKLKNYKSLYLTLSNWLRSDKKTQRSEPQYADLTGIGMV